jgi:hypothetical protein
LSGVTVRTTVLADNRVHVEIRSSVTVPFTAVLGDSSPTVGLSGAASAVLRCGDAGARTCG